MKIVEILNETSSPEMAFTKVGLSMREFNAVLRDIQQDMEYALQIEEPNKGILPAQSKIGRWFAGNFTTQKGKPSHGLRNSLETLGNQKTFADIIHPAMKQIILTANRDKLKYATSSGSTPKLRSSFEQMSHIVSMLQQVYSKAATTHFKNIIAPNFLRDVQQTETLMQQVKDTLRSLRAMAKAHKQGTSVNPERRPSSTNANQDNQLGGQQRDAATKIAMDHIATLPKQYQHQLRQLVGKSDNKLQTLQRAMQELGLA